MHRVSISVVSGQSFGLSTKTTRAWIPWAVWNLGQVCSQFTWSHGAIWKSTWL